MLLPDPTDLDTRPSPFSAVSFYPCRMSSVGADAEDSPVVLHVDDEASLVDLASTFLEREGLTVETATDAERGLELLDDRSIEAIVSDYDMPGTDGLEFLAAVREDHPDLPFILFTGKGSEEIASEAISRGVTDYLQKEIGTDQYAVLANRIQESVRRYRAEAELAEARRRHETLLANLPGMVYRCTITEGWPMSFASEGCRSLTGYDPEDLVSGAVDWEHEVIVPEDRQRARRIVDDALARDEPFELTYEIVRKDGETRTVWEQGRAIDAADAVDSDAPILEGFITDVTARERNERELQAVSATQRAVLQRVADGVVVLDPEAHAVVETNGAAADLTGYAECELVSLDPATLLDPADVDLGDLAASETFDRRLSIAAPDGTARIFDVTGCTLTFESAPRVVLVLSPAE
jgi:PAS domain S-box-containing protein